MSRRTGSRIRLDDGDRHAARSAVRRSTTTRRETEWFEAVHAVHQRMLLEMDLSAIEKLDAARAREAVTVAARQLVTQQFPSLLGDDRERVIKRVIDEAIGFGPIEPLLDDDNDLRSHGQRAGRGLLRARRHHPPLAAAVPRQPAHHAHHRADHRAARPARRRVVAVSWMRACRTARA